MAEKTPTKPFLDSLLARPKASYCSVDNGPITPWNLIVRTEGWHLPQTWRRANTTFTRDQINHEREGHTTNLPGGGTFTIYGMAGQERETFVEVNERLSAYSPEQKVALFMEISEATKEQERKARNERMHGFIGMFADIDQDSVELQKELREDWS